MQIQILWIQKDTFVSVLCIFNAILKLSPAFIKSKVKTYLFLKLSNISGIDSTNHSYKAAYASQSQ